jgi:hypothetical protein
MWHPKPSGADHVIHKEKKGFIAASHGKQTRSLIKRYSQTFSVTTSAARNILEK